MSSGGWMPPHEGQQGTEVAGAGDYGQRPTYAMRPLSLGEILDRSFAVYRTNFWLFAGIAVLSAAVQLVAQAVVLVVTRGVIPVTRPGQNPLQAFHVHLVGRQIGSGIGTLLFYLAAAVTQAATVWALSEVYLGRRTRIGDSIRAVVGRWLRFVGIGLWQGWSLLWLPLLLIVPAIILLARAATMGVMAGVAGGILIFLAMTGGMAFGIVMFLRNSLAVPAAVIEGLTVRAAMRRSKVLAAGAKGRIFVVFLIAWCMFMVAGILEMPLAMIVGFGALKGERHVLLQVVILLVNFVAQSMVTPVLLIGLSLVYFDQRVRQEALDLLLMLGGGTAVATERDTAGTSLETRAEGPASDAAAV